MKRKSFIVAMVVTLVSFSFLFAENLERKGNEAASKGDELFEGGNYEKALVKFQEAKKKYTEAKESGKPVQVKIDKMDTNIYTCYVKLKNYKMVLVFLEKKLKDNPKDYDSVKKISLINQKIIKNYDRAISVRIDYDNVKPMLKNRKLIAKLYYKTSDFQSSIKWYKKALELKNDPGIIKNIAVIYYKKLKDNGKAIEMYTSFLKTLTSDYEKARIYKYMGKLYEDTNHINKAISNYNNSYKAYFDKSIALKSMTLSFDMDNYSMTLKIVDDILAKDSSNTVAIYFKAQVYFAKDMLRESKAEFEKVVTSPEYGSSAKEFIKSINSKL